VSILQSPADDEDLVQQIAAGHLDSLGVLFDRYHKPLRTFFWRMQVPEGDLDDLVQSTFMQLPRAAARFERGRPVPAAVDRGPAGPEDARLLACDRFEVVAEPLGMVERD